MKNVDRRIKSRRDVISKIVSEEKITTQNEIIERLNEMGYSATQATVSRDIRELQLIKVTDIDGNFRYAAGKTKDQYHAQNKFYTIFAASVEDVKCANNLVVVRCFTGMAQAVCACIDGMEFEGILGTVAGDDTILVIADTNESAQTMTAKLKEIH